MLLNNPLVNFFFLGKAENTREAQTGDKHADEHFFFINLFYYLPETTYSLVETIHKYFSHPKA